MSPRRAADRDEAALERLRREQDSVVTRRQLAELGFGRDHVRRRIGARQWQPWGHRVVILSAAPLSTDQRCRAALLHAGPTAALAGLTALGQQGLRGWTREHIHVVVPAGTYVATMPEIRVHRSHRLRDSDTVAVRGMRMTTVARSALDAARWDRSARTAEALMMAVVQQRLCTPAELEDALAAFVKVKQSVAIVDGVVEARSGADSKSEADVASIMQRAGFPPPRRQVELITTAGVRPVDLAVDLGSGRMLIVEVDGPRHDDEEVRLIDAVKDAAAIADGHQVLRIPASAARQHPERLLLEFRELRQRLM